MRNNGNTLPALIDALESLNVYIDGFYYSTIGNPINSSTLEIAKHEAEQIYHAFITRGEIKEFKEALIKIDFDVLHVYTLDGNPYFRDIAQNIVKHYLGDL